MPNLLIRVELLYFTINFKQMSEENKIVTNSLLTHRHDNFLKDERESFSSTSYVFTRIDSI